MNCDTVLLIFFLKIIAWLFFLSGATFLPRKSYLQLRREAFDFRFRKAHHRTFDGLTVAEAGFPLGYRCYGKEPQKTESMSRCFGEKPFLLFLNFQETILVGFFGWFPFFSTSNWQRKLVGHSWSLSWFWLGQEGIWQGDFSFVQLADPQSLGQSFTALLLEEPALTHFLQYDNKQTFPNHLESGPYCISVFFLLYFFSWNLIILRLGMLHGDKSWEEAPRLELSSAFWWCQWSPSAGKGDVEQRAER